MSTKTMITPTTPTELMATNPERTRLTADPVSLAREMGRAYQEMLTYYRREAAVAEADAKARAPAAPDLEHLLETPSDQLTWWALGCIAGHDPEQARIMWERALAEAFNELTSGHRA